MPCLESLLEQLKVPPNSLHPAVSITPEEKVERLKQVRVVVLPLVAQGEHFVGRRRKDEHGYILPKEPAGN